MKYLIKENKLSKAIYNYFDDWFYDNRVNYTKGYRFAKTDKVILFYPTEGDGDIILSYYPYEYFESYGLEEFYEKAPVLEFVDKNFSERLEGQFGPFWKKPFEKFFEDTYPRFPVKTFMYK